MKLNCMVVDDDELARVMIRKYVEKTDFLELTHELSNGIEASNILLQKDNPDVDIIFLDIEMPEMDGYTLTAEIKNTPELQKLHVVLHTSLSGVFNQAMVQKVGADDFIAKFHPDELATAVQKWLVKKDD